MDYNGEEISPSEWYAAEGVELPSEDDIESEYGFIGLADFDAGDHE